MSIQLINEVMKSISVELVKYGIKKGADYFLNKPDIDRERLFWRKDHILLVGGIYAGETDGNKPNGWGELEFCDMETIAEEIEKTGTYHRTAVYEGYFSHGIPHGFGIITFLSGNHPLKIIGNFDKGALPGQKKGDDAIYLKWIDGRWTAV